ncbi:cuticle protein 18.6-like [Penaeus japonicus]|uniref:cuticle protein 18.6-like n=1 Tax=Penaeus japonicus TaxID=27405 RepID=UPI001C71594D|nr:cuticle protein 18.6-like [Penaeus japonicus]
MRIAVAVFLALAAPLCLAAPQGYDYAAPAPAPAPAPTPYNYAYSVGAVDSLGQPLQFGHQEGREGATTSGRYFVLLPDARLMTVDYYADHTGFHPTYSFQGTAAHPAASPSPGGQAALAAPAAPANLYTAPGGR